jgi:hypothetical protein
MVGEHDAQRVLVIDRHPRVAAQFRELRERGHQGPEGHQKLVDADVVLVVLELAARCDAESGVVLLDLELRRQVGGLFPLIDTAA